MTIREAKEIVDTIGYENTSSEEKWFMYTEALGFLINETKSTSYMMELGGYYYEQRMFDLALKYYEMASSYGDERADECLGYVWYYGRTGERDYKKAFEYFSKAKERGNIVASYKIADMYKNGYYVDKDYEKYKSIIKELYPKVEKPKNAFVPLPEIFTRLARIKVEEGEPEEAIRLYEGAKEVLAVRISDNAFFGNLNIMKWLIDDLYKLTEPDMENIDMFDLYYLLQKPIRIEFFNDMDEETYLVEAIEEDGSVVIKFGDKWYRDVDEFFKNAKIYDNNLTALYFELDGFRVVD